MKKQENLQLLINQDVDVNNLKYRNEDLKKDFK